MKLLKWDYLIILFVFIAAIILLIFFIPKSTSKIVKISLNTNEIQRIDLSRATDGIYEIKNLSGYKYEISNGKIKLLSATCADKICINSGFIQNEGQTIICLPQKLVIEVLGESKEIDIIAN